LQKRGAGSKYTMKDCKKTFELIEDYFKYVIFNFYISHYSRAHNVQLKRSQTVL